MSSLAKVLYEVSEVLAKIEENDGEITNELSFLLEDLQNKVQDKVDRVVFFNDVIHAQIDKTKTTIDKYKRQLQVLENIVLRLSSGIKQTMEAYNMKEIEGHERKIKLCKSGGVEPMHRPDDFFINVKTVNSKYLLKIEENDDNFLEKVSCYIIKNDDMFKKAVRDNKLPHLFYLPRGNYVKFN